MSALNTFVVPIIRSDFIGPMLDSLYKFTKDFNVIVIDQTKDTKAMERSEKQSHLWIRPYRNLGFAKAMNTGAALAQTPYITFCNDDLEFLDERWFGGILDTFATDPRIVAVNPSSVKEGAWGYGLRAENYSDWQPTAGFIRDPDDPDSVIPVKKDGNAFTKEEAMTKPGYEWLLHEHPRWQKDTLCDAIAMWCTTFSREGLKYVGLFDEQFYPGSGEDYDMNCRAYSCGWPIRRDICDESHHKRMVGTTKSWVWHHWGRSKFVSGSESGSELFASRPRWNDCGELWEGAFDVWGHVNTDKGKLPLNRTRPIFIDEL